MKAVRLGDLRDLLQSSAFSAWWTDYGRAVTALREARQRHEDLVAQSETMAVRSELAQRAGVEAFSRAGEVGDEGARSAADAQGLENRALQLVAEHEAQRDRASELWVRLGGAERALEELRDAAAGAGAARSRAAAERQLQALREQYEAADRERARLWDAVEAAWATSFEGSLLGAERALAARSARREAERLFAEAEERRVRAKQLAADAEAARRERAEAEVRRTALLAAARERFGCAPGDAFLYWRREGDGRRAFVVALADGDEGAGGVKALGVYTVGIERGVAAPEPARETGQG